MEDSVKCSVETQTHHSEEETHSQESPFALHTVGKRVNVTFTKNIWIDMKSIQCEDVDAMN